MARRTSFARLSRDLPTGKPLAARFSPTKKRANATGPCRPSETFGNARFGFSPEALLQFGTGAQIVA